MNFLSLQIVKGHSLRGNSAVWRGHNLDRRIELHLQPALSPL